MTDRNIQRSVSRGVGDMAFSSELPSSSCRSLLCPPPLSDSEARLEPFLFLGLGLMARALILSHEHKGFILKHPLNLMAIALLALLFSYYYPRRTPMPWRPFFFRALGSFLVLGPGSRF